MQLKLTPRKHAHQLSSAKRQKAKLTPTVPPLRDHNHSAQCFISSSAICHSVSDLSHSQTLVIGKAPANQAHTHHAAYVNRLLSGSQGLHAILALNGQKSLAYTQDDLTSTLRLRVGVKVDLSLSVPLKISSISNGISRGEDTHSQ
jgi:hypothetical protein